jgi:hypothetical protein
MTEQRQYGTPESRSGEDGCTYVSVNGKTWMLKGEAQRFRLERDGYRKALQDLLCEAEDMRAYVPDYFAKKWHHDEALERAREVLRGA